MANRNVEALTDPLYIGNGVNRTKFDNDGTPSQEGSATVWDDVRASLIGRRLESGVGSIDYNWDEGTVTFQDSGSITSTSDRIILNFQLPHSAKVGSLFRFHIHWWQTNTINRNFTWRYRLLSNGGTVTTAWTEGTTATNVNSAYPYVSGNLNQITNLFEINTADIGLSGLVQVMITRSDSNGGVVEATFLDAHYEKDMNGSREEFVK